jgi:MbtH protein
MSQDPEEDKTIYRVVVDHEEQYSIWPADRENALGWNDAGKTGTKAECVAYIKEVWTDMRPLSLRKRWRKRASNSVEIASAKSWILFGTWRAVSEEAGE